MYYFDPQRFLNLEALVAKFPLAFSGGKAAINLADSAKLDYTAISYWRPIAGTSETESVISPGPATLGPFVFAGSYILSVATLSNTVSADLVAVTTTDTIPLASFTVAITNGPITNLVDLRSAYSKPSPSLTTSGDISGILPGALTVATVGGETAANIAAHIVDTVNPHGTDIANLGSGTLAELNTAVTGSILVASGDIVDADIDASAAIIESKLALNFATHDNTNDPTTDQKAALDNSLAPSGANPFITSLASQPSLLDQRKQRAFIQKGWLMPGGISIWSGGLLESYQLLGTFVGLASTTSGVGQRLVTGASANDTAHMRGIHAAGVSPNLLPYQWWKCGLSHTTFINVFIGWTSSQPSPMLQNDDPAGSYIGFQFRIGRDSNWQAIKKDGVTQTVTDTSVAITTDGLIFELSSDDNTSISITRRILSDTGVELFSDVVTSGGPSLSTGLEISLGVETTTAVAREIIIYGSELSTLGNL